MAYETILFEVEDHIALITLNRPQVMNAWNAQMAAELSEALAACDKEDDVRAVVVTGKGAVFCAGADLISGGDTFARMQGEEAEGGQGFAGLHPWQIHKPVLAAINGHAIGVGITYAMSCDIRFVAEDAKVQFAFVRRGVIPELSSHVIVARVAGLSNAADLLMTGRMITGREIPLFHWTANQSDAREGVEAFLEKREPEWKLRVSRDLPVLLSSSNHLFT